MTELSGLQGDDANGWQQSDRPRPPENVSETDPESASDEWFWELIRGRRSGPPVPA